MSEERTHDYTIRGWGHDYCIQKVDDNGSRLHASGWGHGIAAGHFLLLPTKSGGTTRYQVESIEYQRDPRDMWFAKLQFAPR